MYSDTRSNCVRIRSSLRRCSSATSGANGTGTSPAQHTGPEHFQEALVVGHAQNHRMAGFESEALQGAQQAESALPQPGEGEHALFVFAIDKGDLAILASLRGEEGVERVESGHGVSGQRRASTGPAGCAG